jgi:hypothetical protein
VSCSVSAVSSPAPGFRFHQPGGHIEAHEEVAIGVDVLQGVIEGAKSQRNADGSAEIKSMEIGVSEGNRSACAKTKVDGIKDRRLAAVAGPNQAIYTWTRQPTKALHRPKVFDLKHTDQRHTTSPRSFATRSVPPNRWIQSGPNPPCVSAGDPAELDLQCKCITWGGVTMQGAGYGQDR